jgi:hypothetical protein
MKNHVACLLMLIAACTLHEQKSAQAPLTIKQDNITYIIEIKGVSDSVNILSTRKSGNLISFDEWKLDYPVYTIQVGDIDANGTDDIMVGVIKKTRYDKRMRKRLFIFKLIDGLIRPLWLGSRVAHPLCAFRYCKKQGLNTIITIENERKKNNYLVAEYKWKSFGLDFIRYIKRNEGYKNALMQMNNQ